jgi:hypothetical protein
MQPESFEGREAPHGPDLGIGAGLRNGTATACPGRLTAPLTEAQAGKVMGAE